MWKIILFLLATPLLADECFTSRVENRYKNCIDLANKGHPVAQLLIGNILVRNNNKQALEWINKSADQGYKPAYFSLGILFLEGVIVPKNLKTGAEFIQKALPLPIAMTKLGKLYALGYGVPQNYNMAIKLFNMAIKQKEPNAMLSLASLYEHGLGIEKDIVKAYAWYSLIAYIEKKDYRLISEAKLRLDNLKKLLTAQNLVNANNLIKLLKKEYDL